MEMTHVSPLSGLGSGEISDVLMAGRWRICPRLKAGKKAVSINMNVPNGLVNPKYPVLCSPCIESRIENYTPPPNSE
ncbi:hypothetical protein TWF481_005173 [Arthrobotrys musiformis]|uniref:Uncharacterized protein n=1 Tax=Arthrobotrys musiformis TaxID=47236 RepID=A0AAV9WEE9_9PEZI